MPPYNPCGAGLKLHCEQRVHLEKDLCFSSPTTRIFGIRESCVYLPLLEADWRAATQRFNDDDPVAFRSVKTVGRGGEGLMAAYRTGKRIPLLQQSGVIVLSMTGTP